MTKCWHTSYLCKIIFKIIVMKYFIEILIELEIVIQWRNYKKA